MERIQLLLDESKRLQERSQELRREAAPPSLPLPMVTDGDKISD